MNFTKHRYAKYVATNKAPQEIRINNRKMNYKNFT